MATRIARLPPVGYKTEAANSPCMTASSPDPRPETASIPTKQILSANPGCILSIALRAAIAITSLWANTTSTSSSESISAISFSTVSGFHFPNISFTLMREFKTSIKPRWRSCAGEEPDKPHTSNTVGYFSFTCRFTKKPAWRPIS